VQSSENTATDSGGFWRQTNVHFPYITVKPFFDFKTMNHKNHLYPVPAITTPHPQEQDMPKKHKVTHPHQTVDGETFGQRLRRLRKAAGYTQTALADAIGISHRMVVYYERETSHPPTHLLPHLAQVLGVTTDQLLGIQKVKEVKKKDSRLWQRFSQVEKLPPGQRKKIVDLLDAFLGKFGH